MLGPCVALECLPEVFSKEPSNLSPRGSVYEKTAADGCGTERREPYSRVTRQTFHPEFQGDNNGLRCDFSTREEASMTPDLPLPGDGI